MFHDPTNEHSAHSPTPEPIETSDTNVAFRSYLKTSRVGTIENCGEAEFLSNEHIEKYLLMNVTESLKEDHIPKKLLETHQVRLLNPHMQSVMLEQKKKDGTDIIKNSYLLMMELYRPEDTSYALVLSIEGDVHYFSHPTAYFFHMLDYGDSRNIDADRRIMIHTQEALSPAAFHESIERFTTLKDPTPSYLRLFLRRTLSEMLDYNGPYDWRIDRRCSIEKNSDGKLEMTFDGTKVEGFHLEHNKVLLNVDCHFPSALIAHIERKR